MKRLIDRLQYIRHRPETIVDAGCGTGRGVAALRARYPRARLVALDIAEQMLRQARPRFGRFARKRLVAADVESLPFATGCFDLVFSSLTLQWCNDLRAALAEFARVSRPGALLMFSSFGPATLRELDASWRALDPVPHVHEFVDMHDVGDAMMAAGLSQPVVDSEIIRMEYPAFSALLADLRNIGASNAGISRRRGLMTPRELRRLEASYREQGFEDGKFFASYEVVYGHAWRP